MGRIYVEQRQLQRRKPISGDIARHMYTRLFAGTVVIVAENPRSMLAALRKQWRQLIARLARERASTLRPARKRELDRLITAAEQLVFTMAPPNAQPANATVCIASAHGPPAALPSACHTLYVTCSLWPLALAPVLQGMSYHGLAVMYDAHTAECTAAMISGMLPLRQPKKEYNMMV